MKRPKSAPIPLSQRAARMKKYQKDYRSMWEYNNKKEVRDRKKEWYKENLLEIRTSHREGHYRRNYKMTIEEIELMLKNQNNKCFICESLISFGGTGGAHIDHDHDTNMVRGILCNKCNAGIGLLGDNITTLFNAINYLREFSGWGKKKVS